MKDSVKQGLKFFGVTLMGIAGFILLIIIISGGFNGDSITTANFAIAMIAFFVLGVIFRITSASIKIFIYFMATLLLAGLWAWGNFSELGVKVKELSQTIFYVIIAIFVLVAIFNLLGVRRFNIIKNKLEKEEQQNDNEVKKELPEIYKKLRKICLKLINFDTFFTYSLIILLFLFSFCIGSYLNGIVVAQIVCLIVTVYFLFGQIHYLLSAPNDFVNDYQNKIINNKAFPSIYEVVLSAYNKAEIKKPFQIEMAFEDVRIEYDKKIYKLKLNPIFCSVLTKNELYNLLLQNFIKEKNRVENHDDEFIYKFNQLSFNYSVFSIYKVVYFLQLTFIQSLILLFLQDYVAILTRYNEKIADEKTSEIGDKQDLINAYSKLKMLDIFHDSCCPELSYYAFAEEKTPQNYFDMVVSSFYKYREANKKNWENMLKDELATTVDKSPTLSERLNYLDVNKFDYSLEEQEEKYIKEREFFLKVANDNFVKENEQGYAQLRDERYLKYKNDIDEYNALKEQCINLTSSQKNYYALSFCEVDLDMALALSKEVLMQSVDNPTANYIAGKVYYLKNDDRCIEFLYRAMELKPKYSGIIFEMIENFAKINGRSDILNELNDKKESLLLAYDEYLKFTQEMNNCDFVQCDLEKSKVNEIVQTIVNKFAKNSIMYLYLAKKIRKTNNTACYAVMIQFSEVSFVNGKKYYTDLMNRRRISSNVDQYLFLRDEALDFEIVDFNVNSKATKEILILNSKVYFYGQNL